MIDYAQNIQGSQLSIYDPIDPQDKALWIPRAELEALLNAGLSQFSLQGLPIRTRSKVVKQQICKILGYPVPRTFKKTQPRFIGQDFDVYIQKSNNLQIWNEDIQPDRRYVLVRVSAEDLIERVKVVTGDVLERLDTTGTLTQKYQARLSVGVEPAELIVEKDTLPLQKLFDQNQADRKTADRATGNQAISTDTPIPQNLLPIAELFERLKPLVGQEFEDAGYDQERNRGAILHRLVCRQLGYEQCPDDGRFPDIRNQLLEIKLQTSSTIDLGLVRPNSEALLAMPEINGLRIRHCDVRYALFYGRTDGNMVVLSHFFLTTGAAFFSRFQQFQGQVVNRKIQIPLPKDFF
jgi:hypothetical protein